MPPLDKKIKKFLKDSVRIAPKISSKGELTELRTGLVSPYPQTRKDAIKKTIQQMTVGKDVSSLFPDVLKNIATNDVEQKKLVYLYVMNYAETHPELCILAVNTFVTDSEDPNPLIRCMAVRTMSMIRVDKILDYLETPLRRTLQDDNPYVRKTAVICVAKVFQLDKQLCLNLGVLTDLVSALEDPNPVVVANTIASLTEIYAMDSTVINLNDLIQSHVSKFLLALNECTEWARITILTVLSKYSAKDSIEAQDIIDRVTAHLQHVNPAVVLATVKVIIINLDLTKPQINDPVMKKLSSAMISIMSTPPEIQFIALKNIRIILEKYPELLTKETRIFFVKFNDPLYVKLEKIEILVRLVDASNIKQCTILLNELKEYTREFEPEFVSKAIQALSQLAIKYSKESFCNKVLDILLELLERQDTFKDDCCIAISNLLRHCPTSTQMVTQACGLLNTWVEPELILNRDEAKCNYVWLLGQYPDKFSSLEERILGFVENFRQEDPLTQTAVLATIVRLHTRLPGTILQTILELATKETIVIDIRDMAMMYWRCLSIPGGDELVQQLCNTAPPAIDNILDTFPPEILKKLIQELATISSITFRPQATNAKKYVRPETVVKGKKLDELKNIAKNEIVKNDEVLLDFGDDATEENNKNTTTLDDLDDLFNFGTVLPKESNSGTNLESDFNKLGINGGRQDTNTTSTSTTTQDLMDLF
ncbi:hypothetical protein TBLA_0B09110 [Henningerozyma blattae CBS 6284]|uniref:AP complex subunit beta n=1 Tax=Henningerozyma blattae (strain ATCC 34711 / CBS 6284 / DSM 70876 / NBRC 10599 / NRRL Y-10934 / UCD 77-7) TaxID=1071380 RepID=I2H024_HENB6|nr:hypothetical protein TBLA_0B09110 [Tetrapisispora blattae CBS 6284]CCH59726.1 hypothetical protein TBLA_0B09110 [Tetrapisispora blattae CBS 6284]